jgi:phosphoglycolate phosphatase
LYHIKPAMKIKGIIFDLDGTLVDSLADIGEAMNLVLSRHGLPVHEIRDYAWFVGDGLDLTVARAIPSFMRKDNFVSELLKEFRGFYQTSCLDKTGPYPGIVHMLQALEERGVITAVLSNKSEDFTRHIVQSLFPDNRFRNISGVGPNVPKKPDPTETLRILGSWNIRPEEGLFVGDLPADMETARRAGMRAVGVSWGFRGTEGFREENVGLISQPSELLEIVDAG